MAFQSTSNEQRDNVLGSITKSISNVDYCNRYYHSSIAVYLSLSVTVCHSAKTAG